MPFLPRAPLALLTVTLLIMLLAPSLAFGAALPLDEAYRDEASCDAVQALSAPAAPIVDDIGADDTGDEDGEDAADTEDGDEPLTESERTRLAQAVQDGVTLSATRVTGPGDWACTFPEVWEAGADRWIALSACDAGGDFFPALLTVERLGDRLRLRLGDSADAVTMRTCPVSPPEAETLEPSSTPEPSETTPTD